MKIQFPLALATAALFCIAGAASASTRVHRQTSERPTQAQQQQLQEDGAAFLPPHETAFEKYMFERTEEPVD